MATRVLIVDDAAFMRMMVKDILSKNGYEIVGEAENGMKALEKYQELKPDLVTMDITMPKMDGMEVLTEIKKVKPEIPFVMISGHGDLETAVNAMRLGAYDYISKPPDLNRLLNTVRNALDKK